jgi:hypothetical protein
MDYRDPVLKKKLLPGTVARTCTQEVENRRTTVQGQPREKVLKITISTNGACLSFQLKEA